MRIAVVGLGAVGEACAHAFTSSEVARGLVLLNRTDNVAPGIAEDLRQSRAWGRPLDTGFSSLEDWKILKGCDLIVLTIGARIKGDQDRSVMAKSTASLLRGTMEHPGFLDSLKQLLAHDKDSAPLVLVVSNPVEATVTWLLNETGWPPKRMFGLGTTVESARYSGFLAQALTVDAGSVWVDIIGEHGERFTPLDVDRLRKMFPAKKIEVVLKDAEKETRSAAKTIRTYSELLGREKVAKITSRLKATMKGKIANKDLDLITTALEEDLQWSLSPPATRYAIAASANMVAKALRENSNQVLTVSALPPSGLVSPQVALALPFVVGRAGIGDCLLQDVPDIVQEAARAIEKQVVSMSALQ